MNKKLRITAWAGLIGALAMYAGDMLLYFTTESFADIEQELLPSMGLVSSARLFAGGVVAPFAMGLYLLGFYHLYLSVQPTHKKWGLGCFLLLSLGILFGGAYHAFFPAFGIVSREGYPHLITPLMQYASIVGGISFVCQSIGWLLYGYLILRRATRFSRWVTLALPIVTLWVGELFKVLPAPFAILIGGGWFNHILSLFFIVTLTTLPSKENVTAFHRS